MAEGTWATKGWMLSQSTMALAGIRWASLRGRSLRRTGRLVGSTPMTSKVAVHGCQLYLVGPDQSRTDDVDEVPGRQVLGQEQLTRAPFETGQVERLALELDAARADTADE